MNVKEFISFNKGESLEEKIYETFPILTLLTDDRDIPMELKDKVVDFIKENIEKKSNIVVDYILKNTKDNTIFIDCKDDEVREALASSSIYKVSQDGYTYVLRLDGDKIVGRKYKL